MYLLVLICLIYLIKTQQEFPKLPSNCTTSQLQMVKSSILACQVSNYGDSALCIRKNIQTNYSGQLWNVFVKNSDTNIDTVSFWYIDTCIVQLTKFGTLNRTYIVWYLMTQNEYKSDKTQKLQSLSINSRDINETSLNIKQLVTQQDTTQAPQTYIHKYHHSTFNQPQTLKTGDICPKWKNQTIQQILTLCDLPKLDHSANCIIDRVKNQLGEYWNVYISTSTKSPSMISVLYNDCIILEGTVGAYNRCIIVWKTLSIIDY